MNKKIVVGFIVVVFLLVVSFSVCFFMKKAQNKPIEKLEATVLEVNDSSMTVMDSNHSIYTLDVNINAKVGDEAVIEYTGLLDKNKNIQSIKVVNYKVLSVAKD